MDDNDENSDAKDKDAATMRPQDKFKLNLGKTTYFFNANTKGGGGEGGMVAGGKITM